MEALMFLRIRIYYCSPSPTFLLDDGLEWMKRAGNCVQYTTTHALPPLFPCLAFPNDETRKFPYLLRISPFYWGER